MSPNKPKDISEEMYHRVYRLVKRNVNPHTIAATLNLPLRTILGVINRVERPDLSDGSTSAVETPRESQSETQEFLDIYFYPKTRYAILDLVGVLTDSCTEKLLVELDKVLASSWKAVAIRMSDVSALSISIGTLLIEYKEKFNVLSRFLAILDPSPAIEGTLIECKIEQIIPVFGTESAFEDAAFSKKAKTFVRRGAQSS